MAVLVKNNAYSTLASGINDSITSITITTGTGSRFPSLGASDYFYATLIDTSNNLEVVKVTARVADTLTVLRGQDNTTARAYSTGARIELRVTAALIEDIRDGIIPGDGTVTTDKIVNGAVTAQKLAAPVQEFLVPVGALLPYAGTTAPSGWLFCFGQALSRTTYAALFAALGTTHGAGDGATTFNLPDLRGRVIAGQDDMGGTSANRLTGQSGGVDGDVLGATGGAETHTLTTAQMPAHTHSFTYTERNRGDGSGSVADIIQTSGGINVTTQPTGGSSAHNNIPPTIILNYIVKV